MVEGRSLWRIVIFVYTLAVLGALVLAAVLYIIHPNWSEPYFKVAWVKGVVHAIWYAMLGGCAISLKGVYDHWRAGDWITWQWEPWFVGRPFSAGIVGIVTFVGLQATNTTSPSIPVLCVASFILGMQEKRFFDFIAALATVILTVPGDKAVGLQVVEVSPTKGRMGGPLVVRGSGIARGARILLGGQSVTETTVTTDGSSIAGLIPGIPGQTGVVEVVVANPDGAARVVANGFTYEP